MCVGSPIAGTWSSSQWRLDNEFETDTRLDRTVAIKVLPEHVAANSELKQRFEREAKTISSLNHPHICTLHDVGNQDGIDFLVMEHLEGETLASVQRSKSDDRSGQASVVQHS